MDLGELVNKYNFAVQVGSYGVKWTLSLETSSGKRHVLALAGADVDNAMQLMHRDKSMYFDAKTQTLSTGWNDPGA